MFLHYYWVTKWGVVISLIGKYFKFVYINRKKMWKDFIELIFTWRECGNFAPLLMCNI